MSNTPHQPHDDAAPPPGDPDLDGAPELDPLDDDEASFWERAYLQELARPDPHGERLSDPTTFLEQTEAGADAALRSRRTLDIANAPYMWPGAYVIVAKTKGALYVGIAMSVRGDYVDLEEARLLTSDQPIAAATYATTGPAAGTTIGPTVGIQRILGVGEILICSDEAAAAFDRHEDARTRQPQQGRPPPPAAPARPARRG